MTEDAPAFPPKSPRKYPLIVKILVAVLLAVGAVAAYAANLPDDFRVERTKTISAAPGAVFDQVNDFHNWEKWSPWAKLDPQAQNQFEGEESGVGAIFKWSGNDQVGVGTMRIRSVQLNELIRIQLDFEKPMQDTSTTEFTFVPQGDQTLVTWSMSGRYTSVFQKLMCKIMDMDKMIGSKFDEGLTSLKQTVEASK